MKGYGQFCPIAKAAEVLGERWTLLVIREIAFGSRRYNELRQGLPRMSPSLLAKRLRELERSGVIRRVASLNGRGATYHLTDAGEALKPLLDLLASWSHRWPRTEPGTDDLDPRFLMWSIRRNIRVEYLPRERRVFYIEFKDGPKHLKRWWLVVQEGEVDLCLKDPGHEVHLWIYTDVETLTRLFQCRMTLAQAGTAGRLRLNGSSNLLKTMKLWFGRPAERHKESPLPL